MRPTSKLMECQYCGHLQNQYRMWVCSICGGRNWKEWEKPERKMFWEYDVEPYDWEE